MPPTVTENGSSISVREALRMRTTTMKYDSQPTHRRGREIRFVEGEAINPSDQDVDHLIITARKYGRLKQIMEKVHAVTQKKRRDELVALAASTGVRGVINRLSRTVTNVIPSAELTFDQKLLAERLGPVAYAANVKRKIVGTVEVEHGLETDRGPMTEELAREMIFLGGVALGMRREDLEPVVSAETSYLVDQPGLFELTKNGVDLEGTGDASQSWSVTHKPLGKQ